MSAEDRAAVKGGLTNAQFDALLRAIRETVRAEIRAEFEGRRDAAPNVDTRDAFMTDEGLVWLEGPDWERVKRAYHVFDREALNEAARKFVEANPDLPKVA